MVLHTLLNLLRTFIVIVAFTMGLWLVWLYVFVGDWKNLAAGMLWIAWSILVAVPRRR